MKFGLMFFASSEDALVGDKYSLIIESAQFADRCGFSSIWTPERHFTKFGSLYPNPAVLNAALARETRQIRLQAGSVVLPIHNPIRIAEEWAVVDNLSAGRIGISFASGWNPNDFVFFPQEYKDRHQELFIGIEMIRKLWRGESISVTNGNGNQVNIRTYPTPIQPELPIWITAASNPKTFIKAGEIGANLLSHLLDQDIEELAEKIFLYRQARAKHGHNPETGIVSIMLHTFVGHNFDAVREQVRVPYCEYLKSNIGLLKGLAQSRGFNIDISTLSEKDLDEFVNFLFERFATSRGLIGTPETCLDLLKQLSNIGVDEVSCLLDFGPSKNLILEHLPYLNQLRELYNTEITEQQYSIVNTNILLNSIEKTCQKEQTLSIKKETLTDIRKRCTEQKSAEEYYKILHDYGIQLGKTCQEIEYLWLGKGEALAQVKLHAIEANSHDSIKIYPVLLEACHQVLGATLLDEMLSKNNPSIYLPIGIRSFQIHEPMSNEIWSYALLLDSVDTVKDSIEGDVRLFDQDGKLLVEVSGLQMRRITDISHQTRTQDKYADWFYELQWQLKPLLKSKFSLDREASSWLIFADSLGIAQKLVELLEEQGQICFVVRYDQDYKVSDEKQFWINPQHPEQMQQLILHILAQQPTCQNVVHLWSLDVTSSEQTTIDSLQQDQIITVASSLHLLQELANQDATPNVWFITQGVQPFKTKLSSLAIAQAPLWGLGQVAAVEYSLSRIGLVDLDVESPPYEEVALQLLETISHKDGENLIAFRGGQRYVSRLVPHQQLFLKQQKNPISSDVTYLITGGLGGLGLKLANWLVEQGARHLTLVGRSHISDASEKFLTHLRQMGVEITAIQADVSKSEEVSQVIKYIDKALPPLKGIFHLAGIPDAKILSEQNWENFTKVRAAKVEGAWNLHYLTQDKDLDFFVLFSSVASVFPYYGQASYAAASKFLDALAHYRCAQGQPTTSINWGFWDEVGHFTTLHQAAKAAISIGMTPIEPNQGLEILEILLQQTLPQIAVLSVDWSQMLSSLYVTSYPSLLSDIAQQISRPLETDQLALERKAKILQQLEVATDSERYEWLITRFQSDIAQVLGVSTAQMDVHQPLNAMGLDSLMAVELRNRVKTTLGVDISIVKFIEGISVATLATEINEQLARKHISQGSEMENNGQIHQTDVEDERVRGEL